MLIDIEAPGLNALIVKFDAMPKKLHDLTLLKMNQLQIELIRRTREKLSGPVLQAKSGALRASIAGRLQDNHDSLVATVGSYGIAYAKIQELGGRTGPHTILPSKASVLHFFVDGKEIFTKRVNHPGSNIPARSYLISTLDEMRPEIIRGIGEAAVEAAVL